jgi:hypothetical protein
VSKLLLTWEQFLYELSAQGFCYDKHSHSWQRKDGACASDESLRDLHTHWPVLVTAALRLWQEGNKTVSVETGWENGSFVARLKAVE